MDGYLVGLGMELRTLFLLIGILLVRVLEFLVILCLVIYLKEILLFIFYSDYVLI